MKHYVAHLDIDAFLASVEQVKHRLEGKPVVVGTGIVCSASYEARRYGIKMGTLMRYVRKLCPPVKIFRGHYSDYRRYAETVFRICRDFTPAVEEASMDEAFLDLSGLERLYGHPVAVADRLKRRIKEETGLNVSIGIASNRLIAKMASRFAKPNGLAYIFSGKEAAFISDMPPQELPGIGRRTAEVLLKLNIRTISQLHRIPRQEMERAFGKAGGVIYQRCRGIDSSLVEEKGIPKAISRETSFDEYTTDLNFVEGMLYYLTERATRKMRSLQLKAKRVKVKIEYSDYESAEASRSLDYPSDLDGEIFGLARKILEGLFTRRVSLRLVGVTLTNFSQNRDEQADLFASCGKRRLIHLYRAIDRIRERYGFPALVAGNSIALLNKVKQDEEGFELRTSSLTQ